MGRNSPESAARGKQQERARTRSYAAIRDGAIPGWLSVFPQGWKPNTKAVERLTIGLTAGGKAMFCECLIWQMELMGLNYGGLARYEFRESLGFREEFWSGMTIGQRWWWRKMKAAAEVGRLARESARLEGVRKLMRAKEKRYKERQKVKNGVAEKRRRREEMALLRKERLALRREAMKERGKLLAGWKAKYGHLFEKRVAGRQAAQRRREQMELASDAATKRMIGRIHAGPVVCYWCGKKLPAGGEVDHVIPLAKGGRHDTSNLAASCGRCNNRKSDTMPQDVELPLGPALL